MNYFQKLLRPPKNINLPKPNSFQLHVSHKKFLRFSYNFQPKNIIFLKAHVSVERHIGHAAMQAHVRIFKFKFILLCKWQVIECVKKFKKLVAAWRVGLNSLLKYHVGQKIKVKLITCSTTGQNILDIVPYFYIHFHTKNSNIQLKL
jgi:hypothetical protein